jgi:hypothetical protein
MKPFFTPEFFKQISLDFDNSNWSGSVYDLYALCADKKLEREGKIVYFDSQHNWVEGYPVNMLGENPDVTKKALLICIEPIEQCKHPKDRVRRKPYEPGYLGLYDYQCQCGAVVEPEGFKEVEEE